MTAGPEHYRTAERLIGYAEGETDAHKRASLHARAQVHATLALAAATALKNDSPHDGYGLPPDDWAAWDKAAGVRRLGGES